MCEFATVASEILFAILPDSDIGKILGLLIIVWLVFVVTGKFRLEWLAFGSRHVYRWLRCKIADKHYVGYVGVVNPDDSYVRRFSQCRICGKRYHQVN